MENGILIKKVPNKYSAYLTNGCLEIRMAAGKSSIWVRDLVNEPVTLPAALNALEKMGVDAKTRRFIGNGDTAPVHLPVEDVEEILANPEIVKSIALDKKQRDEREELSKKAKFERKNIDDKAEKFMVLQWATSWSELEIIEARRFTPEEKEKYNEWFAETGFVGIVDGKRIKIECYNISDLPTRTSDGSFLGCDNRAWILSEDEINNLVKINEERLIKKQEYEKKCAEEENERTKNHCPIKARNFDLIHNEGYGDGYNPYRD